MSTRDEDILDFDFFEEEDAPAWEEPEGLEPLPPTERGRRGGGSRFGGPRNLTPLLRLIGLVALAILVVVLLVVWVEGCTADAKRDRNETYLAEIGAIGNASARLGQDVSVLLTTPGPQSGGSRREARRLRADGRQSGAARAGSECARAHGRTEHGCSRGAALSRERPAWPADRVQGHRGRDRRERGRRGAPGPNTTSSRERHHLDGLVPGAGRGGAAGGGDRGSRRPVLRVPHGGRPRDPERPGCGLAARPGRVDRRDANRPARQPDLVRQGASERRAALDGRPRRPSR